MRIIRRDNRDAIFERLEGWWNNTIVDLLTGKRKEAIFGYEISDCGGQAKLATDLEFFQNNRSDSFGVKPPLY